mmetsp:Transcript_77984/g.114159  ORF Transcript_77984/g.114159 Transcript_77984/m.114159 type:complete len:214 (+) Transcript_77984:432-1073(+)
MELLRLRHVCHIELLLEASSAVLKTHNECTFRAVSRCGQFGLALLLLPFSRPIPLFICTGVHGRRSRELRGQRSRLLRCTAFSQNCKLVLSDSSSSSGRGHARETAQFSSLFCLTLGNRHLYLQCLHRAFGRTLILECDLHGGVLLGAHAFALIVHNLGKRLHTRLQHLVHATSLRPSRQLVPAPTAGQCLRGTCNTTHCTSLAGKQVRLVGL